MAWAFVNVGGRAAGNNSSSLTANLYTNNAAGDLMVIVAYARGTGTTAPKSPTTPTDWSEAARYDGSYTYGHIAVFYKVHDGSESNTAVDFSGTGGSGSSEMVAMFGFTGNHPTQASVLGTVGSDSYWSAAQDIGPVTGLTPADSDCLLLVLAARQQDMGTNGDSTVVSVLSGDSQTFYEIFETGTTIGSDCGIVVDYAFMTGTPTITDKTFTNSDTQTAAGCGMMVTFKPDPNLYVSVADAFRNKEALD